MKSLDCAWQPRSIYDGCYGFLSVMYDLLDRKGIILLEEVERTSEAESMEWWGKEYGSSFSFYANDDGSHRV